MENLVVGLAVGILGSLILRIWWRWWRRLVNADEVISKGLDRARLIEEYYGKIMPNCHRLEHLLDKAGKWEYLSRRLDDQKSAIEAQEREIKSLKSDLYNAKAQNRL